MWSGSEWYDHVGDYTRSYVLFTPSVSHEPDSVCRRDVLHAVNEDDQSREMAREPAREPAREMADMTPDETTAATPAHRDTIREFMCDGGTRSADRLRSLLLDSPATARHDDRRAVAALVAAFELDIVGMPSREIAVLRTTMVARHGFSPELVDRALATWVEVLGATEDGPYEVTGPPPPPTMSPSVSPSMSPSPPTTGPRAVAVARWIVTVGAALWFAFLCRR